MIGLLFKASDDNQAQLVLERHGIPHAVFRSKDRFEFNYSCADRYLANVQAWFLADIGDRAPYSMGSLLFYSQRKDT